MKLVHFAHSPSLDLAQTYTQSDYRGSYSKPHGLWLSDEDAELSWSVWCQENDYCNTSAQNAFEVKLKRDAKVCRIRDEYELRDLDRLYRVPAKFGAWAIDWPAVTERYDGLLITPYIWQERLSLDWYYGWDCASGCIWNLRAITSVELLCASLSSSKEPKSD